MEPPARIRAWGALLAALACTAAFWVAGEAAGQYLVLYGRHGWSASETAFLLNYVLLGAPCGLLLTLALGDSVGARLVDAFDRLTDVPPRLVSAVGLVGATVIAVVVIAARYGLLRNTAITDDEHVYDFMARVWATGRLYAPSPPLEVRAFFDNQFIVNDDRWYGIYAPGHPLALTVGQLLGAVRWTTTVEAVLTLPMAAIVARRIFGTRAAVLTVLLLVVSPFFILVSATMLAHATAALALIIFVYGCLRLLETPEATRWWLVAAAAVGWAGLTRPLSAVALALPWMVLLGGAARRRRDARRGAAVFVICALTAAGLFAAYNTAVTGHPLRTGYHVFADTHGFTFTLGSLTGVLPPFAALYELFYACARLNFWLFGWPASLVFLAWYARSPAATALAAGCALVIAAYAVLRVPSINVVGPVHYGELAVPLAMLSASGIERLAQRARDVLGPRAMARVVALPVAFALVAAFYFWPVYGPALRMMANVARAPYDLVEDFGIDNAVVFVDTLPSLQGIPGAWVYRPRNNSPDLSDHVLFVNDRGPENDRLRARLPGRKAYRMAMQDGALVLSPLP